MLEQLSKVLTGERCLKGAGLTALFAFSTTSGYSGLSLALLLAGALAAWLGERIKGTMAQFGGVVLVALVGAFLLAPLPPEGHHFFEPGLSTAYQGGLVAGVAVVTLMLWELSGALIYLRLAACFGLMLSAGVQREALPFGYLVGLVLLFVLLFLRTRHRARPLTASSLAAVVLVMVLGSGMAIGLKWAETQFSSIFELISSSSGSSVFSPRSDLQWASRRQTSTKLVARVFAKKSPVHMTGMRYLKYANNSWTSAPGKESLPRTETRIFEGKIPTYQLAPLPDQYSTLKVELANLPAISLLHPNPCMAVGLGLDQLKRGPTGTLYLPSQAPFTGTYWTATGKSTEPAPSEEFLELALALPEDCPPQVHQLAEQLVLGAPNQFQALDQVESYFQENFEYGFGRSPQRGENMLEVFLAQKPPAHCELFATATAMVLRAGGIPCRYVNGFLVSEQSRFGNYWVTRDRDAHAWVEAYLPGHGWVTVDSTPPGALESPPVQLWKETMEWLIAAVRNAYRALRYQPLDFLKSFPGVLLGVLLLGVLIRRIRWPKRAGSKLTGREVDPGITRLQSLFEQFCQLQKTKEAPDKGALTPLEWAERLSPEDELGRQFLAEYSEVRYSHSRPSQTQVDKLEQILRNCQTLG